MRRRDYEVSLPDYHGDDWRVVTSAPWKASGFFEPEEAVERWCELNFSNLDYPSEIEGLRVRPVDEPDQIEAFNITVESVPQFFVTKATPTTKPTGAGGGE